jgi:hypothetical protein
MARAPARSCEGRARPRARHAAGPRAPAPLCAPSSPRGSDVSAVLPCATEPRLAPAFRAPPARRARARPARAARPPPLFPPTDAPNGAQRRAQPPRPLPLGPHAGGDDKNAAGACPDARRSRRAPSPDPTSALSRMPARRPLGPGPMLSVREARRRRRRLRAAARVRGAQTPAAEARPQERACLLSFPLPRDDTRPPPPGAPAPR